VIAHLHLEARARPALRQLVGAMERLPRCQRREIASKGRRAKSAKTERIRRLCREAVAEAKRMADG
jgi:hypothetical protein